MTAVIAALSSVPGKREPVRRPVWPDSAGAYEAKAAIAEPAHTPQPAEEGPANPRAPRTAVGGKVHSVDERFPSGDDASGDAQMPRKHWGDPPRLASAAAPSEEAAESSGVPAHIDVLSGGPPTQAEPGGFSANEKPTSRSSIVFCSRFLHQWRSKKSFIPLLITIFLLEIYAHNQGFSN